MIGLSFCALSTIHGPAEHSVLCLHLSFSAILKQCFGTAGMSGARLCQSLCNSDFHYVFGQDWQETPAHQWMLHHGVVSDQDRTPQ